MAGEKTGYCIVNKMTGKTGLTGADWRYVKLFVYLTEFIV